MKLQIKEILFGLLLLFLLLYVFLLSYQSNVEFDDQNRDSMIPASPPKITSMDLEVIKGEINVFTKIVDWARREAKQRLREQVAEAGYDAVINVRFETTVMSRTRGGKDRTSGVEILAYGTAIKY